MKYFFCLITVYLLTSICLAQGATPDLQPLDEWGSEATVTKESQPSSTKKAETTQVGGQTEVKVTTDVGTYVAKPNQTVGNSLPGDVQSSSNHAAQWVVNSWGTPEITEPLETPPHLAPNKDER